MRQQLRGDELYYSAQAHMNSKGHWFEQAFAAGMPAADHPPLAALVFTPAAALFHDGGFIGAQRLTNILLGTALVPVMFALGMRVGGRRVGFIAAVVTASWLNFIMNDTLVLAETSACLCLAVGLLFAHRATTATGVRHARFAIVGTGFALALGSLARPEMFVLLAAIGVPVALVSVRKVAARRAVTTLGYLTLLGCCAGLIVGPWVLWNRVRFDEAVTMSTNDGFTLAGANCVDTYFGPNLGGYSIDCALAVTYPAGGDAVSGVKISARCSREFCQTTSVAVATRGGDAGGQGVEYR